MSGSAALNGELNLDATGSFAFATGQTFDVLNFKANGLTGNFSSLWLDGQACASTIANASKCGASTTFDEVVNQTTGSISLDVTVSSRAILAGVSRAAFDSPVGLYDPGVNKAVPEPSTWALLLTGFLGLAGFGLRKRRLASGEP